jgi:CRP-like cAMP-binding protein
MTLVVSQPQAGRTNRLPDALLNRFGRLCHLDTDEIGLLQRGDGMLEVRTGALLASPEHPSARFLLSGWAAWVRPAAPIAGRMGDRRQIISFYLPGEPLAVSARPHPLSSGLIVALTPARTCDASAAAHLRAERPDSALARAFRISACLAEAYLVNQSIRLGGLSAHQRLCHLLLELYERMAPTGVCGRYRFPFPLTQETLGEALSLSTVHVNRTLQDLRRDRLVDFVDGLAILPDPERAAAVCGYQSQQPELW